MKNPLKIQWDEYDGNGWCPGCIFCEPEGYAHLLVTILPWWLIPPSLEG